MKKILIIVLISIVVVGGVIYFSAQELFKSKGNVEASDKSGNYDVLADNLDSCTKYKTTFVHPITGETLTREILGIIDGKCVYGEQIPNGGKEECKYSEEQRKAAARAYRDFAKIMGSGNTWGFKSKIDIATGKMEVMLCTYDDKGNEIKCEVSKNVLQDYLDNGICVISGY